MRARLYAAVAVAAILWRRGADGLNVKLIPIETKTIDTDGATHEVSRYVVVPEGHVYSPGDVVATASTDLQTSLGSDQNSTTSEAQSESGILDATPNVSNNIHANIYSHKLQLEEPEASTSSSKSVFLESSKEKKIKQMNNANVSGNTSHRRKDEAKYRSSNKGYSKVKVKVTHYQDPSSMPHHELNGEKIQHSNAYKVYSETVQKEHPDLIAVNIHGSTEQFKAPLDVENEESVKSTSRSTNEEMSDYNEHYKTKIVTKKFKPPIKVTTIDSQDLPIKWDEFFKEPAITKKGEVPTSIPINETFTLPGKRGRFKIIHEDDEDYEYDTIEMPTLVRTKPKGQFHINSTQKYYIDGNKAKKANKANAHIDASFKTFTINKNNRDSAVIHTKSTDKNNRDSAVIHTKSTNSRTKPENYINDDLKFILSNSEMRGESSTITAVIHTKSTDKNNRDSAVIHTKSTNSRTKPENYINDDLKFILSNSEMRGESSTIISDNTAGISNVNKERIEKTQTISLNNKTSGLVEDDKNGDEEIRGDITLVKTNLQHSDITTTPFKSRTNLSNENWLLDSTNENSSAANNPRLRKQKITTIETTKVTQNHTYNTASEPVLYHDHLTLSSHEKDNIKTDDENSRLTSYEDEERTAQTDIMKYNISFEGNDKLKVIPLKVNTKLNSLSPNKRLILKETGQISNNSYKNNEILPHGIIVVSNDKHSKINSHIDETVMQPTTINTIKTNGVRVHPKKTKDNIHTSSSKITSFVKNIHEETTKNKMLPDSLNNHTQIVPAVEETRTFTGLEEEHFKSTPKTDFSHRDDDDVYVSRVEKESILQTKLSKSNTDVLPEYVMNKVINSSRYPQKIVSGSENEITAGPKKLNEYIDIIETVSDTKSENDTQNPPNKVLDYLERQNNSKNKTSHLTHGGNPEVVSTDSPIIKKVIQLAQSLASQCYLIKEGNDHQKDNSPNAYLHTHGDEQSHGDQTKQTDMDSTFKDSHTSSDNVFNNKYQMNVRNDDNVIRGGAGGIYQEYPHYETSGKMNRVTQKEDATNSASDHSRHHLDHDYFKSSPLQTHDGNKNQVFYTRNDANRYSYLHKNIDSQLSQSLLIHLLSHNIIDELSAEYNAAGQIGDKNKIRKATILRHLQILGVTEISEEQLNYLSQLIQEHETYLQNMNSHKMYDIYYATQKNEIVARNNEKQLYLSPYISAAAASPAEGDLRRYLEGYGARSLNKRVSDLSIRVLYHVAYLRRLGTPDADVLKFIADGESVLRALEECCNKSYTDSAQTIDTLAKRYAYRTPHTHYAIQYY